MIIHKDYINYFYFFILITLISGPAVPDILMSIVAITTLIYVIINKKANHLKSLLKLSFIFFVILFTTIFSVNFPIATINFLPDYRYFLYLLSFIVFFNEKYLNKFFLVVSIIIFFLAIDLFIQYTFGQDIFGFKPDMQVNKQRLNGPFDDEYIVGTYIFKISIPLIGYLLFHKREKYAFFIIVLSLISIVFSGERMALILFVFCNFLILLFLKKYKFLILLIFLFSTILLFLYSSFPQIKFKFNEFFYALKNFKDTGHGAHYLAAITIFKEYTLFGSGFRTFRDVCSSEFVNNAFSSKAEHCATHPHNLYLEALTDTGIIGFIGLILIIVFISKYIIENKYYKNEYVGFVAVFIAIFWPLSSNGNFFNNWNAAINLTLVGFLLTKKTVKS